MVEGFGRWSRGGGWWWREGKEGRKEARKEGRGGNAMRGRVARRVHRDAMPPKARGAKSDR